MQRLLQLISEGKRYDSMLFTRNGKWVNLRRDSDNSEAFVKADQVTVKVYHKMMNARAFIRSLSDSDLSQLPSSIEDDEITYVVSIDPITEPLSIKEIVEGVVLIVFTAAFIFFLKSIGLV